MPHASLFQTSSQNGYEANCFGTYFIGDEALAKRISK